MNYEAESIGTIFSVLQLIRISKFYSETVAKFQSETQSSENVEVLFIFGAEIHLFCESICPSSRNAIVTILLRKRLINYSQILLLMVR